MDDAQSGVRVSYSTVEASWLDILGTKDTAEGGRQLGLRWGEVGTRVEDGWSL